MQAGLDAMKAGIQAQQAGIDAMKTGLDAMNAGLVAREERVTAQEKAVMAKEEGVKAKEKAVVAREKAVWAEEMSLGNKWADFHDRKLELDKRDHDCSALDDLKHTLKLIDDAAERSSVRSGSSEDQQEAQQSLAVLAALKDRFVHQVRHLLANDAGLDLTIWCEFPEALEYDLKRMGDLEFQRTSNKDMTSLMDKLVGTVRDLLEYDDFIFH